MYVMVISLFLGGILIQMGGFSNNFQERIGDLPITQGVPFKSLAGPQLELQWMFNCNAYTGLSSQIEVNYVSSSNLTNLFNCDVDPKATINALSGFSEGEHVNITAQGSPTEFYADCHINLTDPIGVIAFQITRIDIIAFVSINTSLQMSQMQLYNQTGGQFDQNSSIETTAQNKTLTISTGIQDYLGVGNNLTVRFYANDTGAIQANITIDGIVAHVYYDVVIPDKLWAVAAGDADGDNLLEFAVAGENGTFICLNGTTGDFLWNYDVAGPIYSLGFGDINADDKDEVIATRVSGTFPKYNNVTVFDFATRQRVGGYNFSGLPAYSVSGVGAGDVQNNSKDEILFLNNIGDLYIFDGETNTQLDRTSPLGNMILFEGGLNRGFDVNLGDIDGDGIPEFVTSGINGGGTNGSTVVSRWQATEVSKVWEFNLDSSAYCSTADFGDIDGDGKAEVVVGSRQNDQEAGGIIYLLNGENASVIWSFDTGSNNIYDISCGDIQNDGREEIAIAVGGTLNQTYILEGENNSILWQIPSAYALSGVELADVNNDGKCEVITIGNEFVNLYCFDTDGDGMTDMDDLDDDDDNLTDVAEYSLYNTNPFLMDSDHDNLSDPAELFAHGTNANWWDTDDDGLSDWMEINIYHTLPNNSNSDGDFLTDGEEIQLGLNPNDPDSDDDGYLDGQTPPGRLEYGWLFYLLLAITCATSFVLAINLRYLRRYRRLGMPEDRTRTKTDNLRKAIKDTVWFWGHGSQVLKNFDKLIAKNMQIITLEALTRTWTQHYKKTFQKVFKLTKEEASERAETQKKKEILELHNLLKDKIDVKKVPIKFGKYAGTDSYQFEVWDEESKPSQKSNEKEKKQNT